uniref:Uncharacterized protein n=1 Tax=Ixodes ricinus TaxID=34613 RepID=A0A6B0UNW7_IXORI
MQCSCDCGDTLEGSLPRFDSEQPSSTPEDPLKQRRRRRRLNCPSSGTWAKGQAPPNSGRGTRAVPRAERGHVLPGHGGIPVADPGASRHWTENCSDAVRFQAFPNGCAQQLRRCSSGWRGR